jgi:putative DNA primase/helicase
VRERFWPYVRQSGDRSRAVTRATLFRAARANGWIDASNLDDEGFDDVPLESTQPIAPAQTQGEVQTSEQRMVMWGEVLDRADTLDDIQDRICPRIAKDKLLGDIDRALVADLVQTRLRGLGANVSIALVRKLVALKVPKTVERFDVALDVKPLTEFGNAQRLIDRFGASLMFVPEHEAWFMWSAAKKNPDGSDGPCVYWRRVSNVEIEHLAKETIKALAREVDSFPDERRAEFFEFCRMSQTAKMVGNMVKLAASDPRVFVPAAELDKHAHLVAARNGVVDLRNGMLHPADSRLRITKVLGCDYDQNAQSPLWTETLAGVFRDDADLIEFFLRTLGYALQGEPKEDVMIIPYGEGSNGKSTCYGIARKAFGTYARSADAGTFIADSGKQGGGGAREDLVRLHGARLVLVGEPDENGELREGSVKSMTGGDALTARAMYAKSSMEILPTWTIVMPTNHKPIIKGSDHGIWRRLRLIPFEVNFDKDPNVKKDGDREKKLEAELPGILTTIVAAGLRYRNGGLVPPGKVRDAVQAYKQDMDLLAEWIEECCDVGPQYECATATLWGSWSRFAQGRGLLRYISNSNALSRRLEQRFPVRRSTGGIRVRLGIRVKFTDDLFLP